MFRGALLRRITLSVVLAVVAIAGTGCTLRGSMHPFYQLNIDTPQKLTVQAVGDAYGDEGSDAARYFNMTIDLRSAPAFTIIFPDGFRANSKMIDRSLLALHLGDAWVSEFSSKGNIAFSFLNDGTATAYSMSIYACKHIFRGVFGVVDGNQTFDFPLKQSEIVQLFGGPVKVIRSYVFFGYDCT